MAEELVEASKGAVALRFYGHDYAVCVHRFDGEFSDEDSAVGGAVEADFAAGGEAERVRERFC